MPLKSNGLPRGRQAVRSGPREDPDCAGSESLLDLLKGVFGPELLLLKLLELQLLARCETQTAVEGFDAFRELFVDLLKVRTLSLLRDVTSLVLGHVTSGVLKWVLKLTKAWTGAGHALSSLSYGFDG